MKSVTFAAVLLCLLAACGDPARQVHDVTPEPVVTPPPPPPPAAPTAAEILDADLEGLTLDDYYDVSYEALTRRSPESIIWNAMTGIYPLDNAMLDNLSGGYVQETFDMVEVALNRLRSYDRSALSADEQLTYDFFEFWLQDELDGRDFADYRFIATYNFFGVHSQTQRFFTDIHPMETLQDAEDYIDRLNDVDRKFENVADQLVRASALGVIEPRLSMDIAIFYFSQIADAAPTDVSYYTAFAAKLAQIPGLSDAERQDLDLKAQSAVRFSVIGGYQAVRDQLNVLRGNAPANIGVGQYPNGVEYYNYMLRHHTTTNLTAAEIHQLGLDELDRIHAEMRVIFDQLGYPQNETLEELFTRVAADGGIIQATDVKTTYENIVAAAEAQLATAFDIFPSADVVVGDDQFGGFYIGPTFDGSRPGTFYAGTQNDEPWYQMPSLAYHEAVPGHHTQIAIAMDQTDGEVFRRTVRFTSFVEGWALYAERLAWELGWYAGDPYGDLGRLQYEALRAARLVMDTGIHAMGWTFEEAVQFNMDNVGSTRNSSEGAAARYSVVPGQSTAYMIGMLQILDQRQRAMDELGSDFDLIGFHRALLTSGGIPLGLLEGVVDRYIAEASGTP